MFPIDMQPIIFVLEVILVVGVTIGGIGAMFWGYYTSFKNILLFLKGYRDEVDPVDVFLPFFLGTLIMYVILGALVWLFPDVVTGEFILVTDQPGE